MCEYKFMGRCFNPKNVKPGVLAVECISCSECGACEMEEE